MSSEKDTITKEQIKEALDLAEKVRMQCGDPKQAANNNINLFRAARLSEPNHSHILATLFRVQNERGEYIVWDSFCEKLRAKGLSLPKSKVSLSVSAEEKWEDYGQIDLAVWGAGLFYVIFENKVLGAKDQYKQLERYIDAVKSWFDLDSEEDIYIVYMPYLEGRQPSLYSWGEYKQEDFKGRYISLSYHNVIIPWLEELYKDESIIKVGSDLHNGLSLYREHLKQLNKINTPMSEEDYKNLIEVIKGTAHSAEVNEAKLLEKLGEIQKVYDTLNEAIWKYWEKQLTRIKEELQLEASLYAHSKNSERGIGLDITLGDTPCFAMIERGSERGNFYIGIKAKEAGKKEDTTQASIKEQAKDKKYDFSNSNWYCWKYVSEGEARKELETLLKDLVRAKLIEITEQSTEQ